jgi:hypothetical protein
MGPFYTADQVARWIDPTGDVITVRSIRTEQDQGRLVGTRIAGKWLYSEADVQAWLQSVRAEPKCQDQTSGQNSSPSVAPEPAKRSSSRGGRKKASGESTASVLADLKKLGKSSRRGSSAGLKSGVPAQVIPLR